MTRAVACAAALSLLAPAASTAQTRHRSVALEESYRAALADLAAGSLGKAVDRVILLENDSVPHCVQAVELRTADSLTASDPEALVAQAFLRLGVREARARVRGPVGSLSYFEDMSVSTVRLLGERYVAASGRSDAPTMAASLLTHLAHGIATPRSAERLEAARDILGAAVKLDRNHLAARYSLAVVLELEGWFGRALAQLDRVLKLEPEDPRVRLRRAVVTVKAGRLEGGRRLLEEATTGGPAWVRELATQELARLLSATGREEDALALLREGLEDLPREKLSLQLAASLDPRWSDSRGTLSAWLAEPHEDAGPSARLIYEARWEEEMKILERTLGSEAFSRLAGLEGGLSSLPDLADPRYKPLPACR